MLLTACNQWHHVLSLERRLLAKEKGLLRQNLVVVVKVKANHIADDTPDVGWSAERRNCTWSHGRHSNLDSVCSILREIVQIKNHVSKTKRIADVLLQFCGYGVRSIDDIDLEHFVQRWVWMERSKHTRCTVIAICIQQR